MIDKRVSEVSDFAGVYIGRVMIKLWFTPISLDLHYLEMMGAWRYNFN